MPGKGRTSRHKARPAAVAAGASGQPGDLCRYRLTTLRNLLAPLKVHYCPSLRSSNSHAMRLRRQERLFAPAVVVAARQTAGRGRGAHAWWSGRGSLTATWVLPVEEQYAPHQLPLIVGLAVRAACAELSLCGEIRLKWPNDVLYQDRKLAGILCERCDGVDLVGIGLNLNFDRAKVPPALSSRIAWLSDIAGAELDINLALAAITTHLKRRLLGRSTRPFAALVEEYRQCDALLGREVRITGGGADRPRSGHCEGIDRDGELLVRSGGRLHRLIAGSVSLA